MDSERESGSEGVREREGADEHMAELHVPGKGGWEWERKLHL